MSKKVNDECVERIEYPVTVPEITEEPREKKKDSFVKRHAADLVVGTMVTMTAAFTIWGMAKGIKDYRSFNAFVRAKYGPNVKEGQYINGSTNKLMPNHTKWERDYKKNFELLRENIKSMNLKSDEWYIIGHDRKDVSKISLTQFMDNARFWHEENQL